MKTYLSLLLCFICLGSAQTSPELLADQALREWQAQKAPSMAELSNLSTDEVCVELPKLLYAAPSGLDINYNDRKVLELEGSSENTLRFSYAASQPGDIVGTVRVSLSREEGQDWHVANIRYLPELGQDGFRTWLSGALGSLVFALFSAFIVYSSFRNSFFRRWLLEAWGYIKEHRRGVIFSIVVLYGLFALGYVTGGSLSQPCGDLIASLVQQSIEQLGIGSTARSGNIAALAAAIFYQNFTFGAFFTTFIPATLFAIPAYLFNGSRFFALALLFGYSGLGSFFQALLAIILFLLELMAYIIITAGGGMMLVTLIKGGFKSLRLAYRKLWMMLPVAMLLLIIGAWYESLIILLPILFNNTP